MDINKCEVLLRAIECGSFSRVALEMGYTQSGISHMIKQLEKEVGFPIFMRNKNGIDLTREGKELLPNIRALVNANNILKQNIDSISGLDHGVLRIGAFTSFTKLILLPVLKQFSQDFPKIHFEITDGSTQKLTRMLTENQIDIGFFSRHSCNSHLKCYPILEDPIQALLPIDHPLAQRESFDVHDFSKEPFIIPTIDGEYDVIRILREFDVKVDFTYATCDHYATISMVQNGMGLALIPETVFKSHECDVAVLPLSIPRYRSLGLFVPSSSELSPSTKRFFTYCRKMIPSILQTL